MKQTFFQLRFYITVMCTRFPDSKGFSAAEQWFNAIFQCKVYFLCEYGIGFMVVFPSFTVTNDGIFNAHFLQHFCTHFPGICAVFCSGTVLRSNIYICFTRQHFFCF